MSAIDRFLKASEYFLTHKDLTGCRKYALKAQESDSNNPSAAKLLAIADTLIAGETLIKSSQPNYYSILQVNLYSNDTNLIRKNFINLITLLNPSTNKYPFASQAQQLVREAWLVLSDAVKKNHYDNEVRMLFGEVGCENLDGFWTICPYCYCVYEYERIYVDCCLRCQNERCLRGFHAVEIAKPPVEVVESESYMCVGFFPLGFDGGEGKGSDSWSPFLPMFTNEKNSIPEGELDKGKDDLRDSNWGDTNRESFVEISDDNDSPRNENVSENVTCEKLKNDGNGKPLMKRRKKTVPKNAKKVMGRGTRLEKRKIVPQSSDGSLDLNTEASEDEAENFGLEFVGEMDMVGRGEFVIDGVEFYDGDDDDVFVGLPDAF